jgi:hypothetical protein
MPTRIAMAAVIAIETTATTTTIDRYSAMRLA